jgi:hypothetical protein
MCDEKQRNRENFNFKSVASAFAASALTVAESVADNSASEELAG